MGLGSTANHVREKQPSVRPGSGRTVQIWLDQKLHPITIIPFTLFPQPHQRTEYHCFSLSHTQWRTYFEQNYKTMTSLINTFIHLSVISLIKIGRKSTNGNVAVSTFFTSWWLCLFLMVPIYWCPYNIGTISWGDNMGMENGLGRDAHGNILLARDGPHSFCMLSHRTPTD